MSEAAAEAIRHAEVHLIDDAGHLVMLEQPQSVNAHLVRFLGE